MTDHDVMVMTPSDEQSEVRLGRSIAEQLVERARADGRSLVGPGGLLADLTKQVLETDRVRPEVRRRSTSSCWRDASDSSGVDDVDVVGEMVGVASPRIDIGQKFVPTSDVTAVTSTSTDSLHRGAMSDDVQFLTQVAGGILGVVDFDIDGATSCGRPLESDIGDRPSTRRARHDSTRITNGRSLDLRIAERSAGPICRPMSDSAVESPHLSKPVDTRSPPSYDPCRSHARRIRR